MKGPVAFISFLVVALLLRTTALTALAARGIVVDVLALATVCWALAGRERWGASFGFAIGLAADLDAAHWLGRHAMAMTLIGYAVGRLSPTLVRESARTQAVLFACATLLHQVWITAFEVASSRAWPYVLQRTLLAVVVTAAVGTLLAGIAQRASGGALFSNARNETEPA